MTNLRKVLKILDILHDNNEQEYMVYRTSSERSFGCDEGKKHRFKYLISNQLKRILIGFQNLTSGYYYDVCGRPSRVSLSPLGK